MSFFKKYLIIQFTLGIITFLYPSASFAQTDTTETAAKTDSIIQYLTPLEYAFMMHEETRFMLRVPVIGVGAEVEVLPYFTVMGEAQEIYDTRYSFRKFVITAEARWYYGSRKKGIRNMSGNYIAMGYRQEAPSIYHIGKSNPNPNLLYAKGGVQRRFLGAGLIDLGLIVGYQKVTYSEKLVLANSNFNNSKIHESIFLRTTGAIGLGFVFNKEKALDMERLCPVTKCYERETSLLKINTLNLLSLEYIDVRETSIVRINPQIGLEQKLFNSPFSIGANLKSNYKWSHTYDADFYYEETVIDLYTRIQTRYYYNLKNRMLKGKSGNGFSANYVSAGIQRDYYSYQGNKIELQENSITLTTGIQRTFSEHIYFDFEIGTAVDLMRGDGLALFGDVQVGVKF